MGLVEDAAMAKQLGYRRYGEFIKDRNKEVPRKVEWTYGPRCEECGAALPPNRRTICSDECKRNRVRRQQRMRYKAGKFI